MKPAIFSKSLFYIGESQPYEGFHIPGDTWNGFICPYFTIEVLRQVIFDHANNINDHNRYEQDILELIGEALMVKFSNDGGEQEISAEVINFEGDQISVYNLTPLYWAWTSK